MNREPAADSAIDLQIRQVRARGIDLTPERPTETAAGTLTSTPLVLIDILTDDPGITGRSYLRCYTPTALQPLTQLVTNLGSLAQGCPAAPAVVDAVLRTHVRLLGADGLTGHALAGIDMALWDALAQRCQVPLTVLLGGRPRPIPCYASLRTMALAGAAAEAEQAVNRGFTAVKLKLGRGGIDADLAAIRAVRSAVGDTVAIMVDYNQTLTVPEAVNRVRVLDDLALYWIEEPTRADDASGHARIAATAQTPIQLGENWIGPRDMARSLAAAASDYATLDAMKIGGVSGWLRAAALAETANIPVSSHTFVELSAHLLAVTPTAHWLEYLDHAGILLTEPLRVRDGHAIVPDRPGNGLHWDEDRISHLLAQQY
jgi:mandelate racemase